MKTIRKNITLNAIQELQKINHFIARSSAIVMQRKYKAFRNRLSKNKAALPFLFPSLPTCISYKKEAIKSLLSQKGCYGLRIYPGITKNNELTMIFVGFNKGGENMCIELPDAGVAVKATDKRSLVVDEGQTSPPYPAPSII